MDKNEIMKTTIRVIGLFLIPGRIVGGEYGLISSKGKINVMLLTQKKEK